MLARGIFLTYEIISSVFCAFFVIPKYSWLTIMSNERSLIICIIKLLHKNVICKFRFLVTVIIMIILFVFAKYFIVEMSDLLVR